MGRQNRTDRSLVTGSAAERGYASPDDREGYHAASDLRETRQPKKHQRERAQHAHTSQPSHIAAQAQQMGQFPVQNTAQHDDALQELGSLAVGLQRIKATAEEIMLQFHKADDVMQAGMQFLQPGIAERNGRQRTNLISHDKPFDRTRGSCEIGPRINGDPLHTTMQIYTHIRIYIQARYRLGVAFPYHGREIACDHPFQTEASSHV